MERFATYVLPNYDDLQSVQHEVRSAVVTAVKQARDTDATYRDTFWRRIQATLWSRSLVSRPIFSIDCVIVNEEAVEATFDAICELFPGAKSDEERKRLLQSAENLSKNNLDIWKQAGP